MLLGFKLGFGEDWTWDGLAVFVGVDVKGSTGETARECTLVDEIRGELWGDAAEECDVWIRHLGLATGDCGGLEVGCGVVDFCEELEVAEWITTVGDKVDEFVRKDCGFGKCAGFIFPFVDHTMAGLYVGKVFD